MISALTLAGQLAAKRSRWQCRNGQKLKTCRPFKSDHQPRVCTRPTPRPAPPAPPNIPEHRTDTAVWSMHEYGCSCSHSARADRARRWQGDRAPAARSAAAAGSPQAARWQVWAAVSDPDHSWQAPGTPSGPGSAGAMSRVSGALREQRAGAAARCRGARRRSRRGTLRITQISG